MDSVICLHDVCPIYRTFVAGINNLYNYDTSRFFSIRKDTPCSQYG